MIGRGDIVYWPSLDRLSWGEGTLWAFAALVIVSAHAVAGAWAMRDPLAMPMQEAASAAIMVELAPAPVAPKTVEQSFAVAPTRVEDAKPDPVVDRPEPDKQDEPIVTLEPMPEPDKKVEKQAVEDDPQVVQKRAEVPMLAKKPKPMPQVTPKDKTRPPVPRKQAARRSQQAAPAQVQAEQAPTAAAMLTSRGLTASVSSVQWQSQLLAHLERRKQYPPGAKSRGEQGTVYVRFSIDTAGNVLSVRLAGASGFAELDQEVLSLVRRASPVPAPPPGVNRTLTVPVRFSVR